jgi:hypothetical protein
LSCYQDYTYLSSNLWSDFADLGVSANKDYSSLRRPFEAVEASQGGKGNLLLRLGLIIKDYESTDENN